MENRYEVPYMGSMEINEDLVLQVTVPGSKSITNRALLLATLAKGESVLDGVLFSDDSRHFLKCVQDLGFETTVDEKNKRVTVKGLGGVVPKKEASIYVGSAGTAARFLAAYLGVSEGTYRLDASEQMKKRPMAPLLASLKELGCEVSFEEKEGFFPFTVRGKGFGTQEITVDIEHSSQFLSALMIASALSKGDMHIGIQGSHGMAYIEITRRMMEQFGVKAAYQEDKREYVVKTGQSYKAQEYQIEPDVSGASYFYALGALLGMPVQVKNVTFDSMQGDMGFLRILQEMGCYLLSGEDGIVLYPPLDGVLHGVEADMSACSDQAITLAAIAPFAQEPVVIKGIGHIRFQECNRMNAIVTELRRMGITCEETDSSITIYPGQPKGCVVETYDDHRMAMGFALTGLKAEGMVIDNPGCCRKTFENYFEVLGDCLKQIREN